MTIIRNLLILISLFPTLAFAEPIWAVKPVQCGSVDEVETLIKKYGETAIFGAMSRVNTDQNDLSVVVEVPVYLFYRSEDKTYTIIEFNIEGNQACIISWGAGVDFDVQKYFE